MPRQKPAGDYGRYRFDETRRAPGRSDGNISRLEAKTRAGPAAPHPFPYQGSKRGIAKFILPYFPPGLDRVVEPCCGSAAVSIAAATHGLARRFWINDLNAPLMALWREISSTSTHHTKALRKRETDVIAMASTTTSSLARYAQ